MSKRIPFNVVFATDEDSEFPSSELNSHGPTVHGWRSKSNSTVTPQEIVLRMHNPAKISRIQVLVHQYLIPDRIELWLHYSPKGAPSTPSSQTYDYLGFIALSDNSSTGYKSRELQSVSVQPRKGTHLKLRFGAPYKNDLNKFGQVALIAVNILGDDLTPADDKLQIQKFEQVDTGGAGAILPQENVDNQLASICDDLAFSMYVEESVADVVRDMEAKKAKAVNDERFEYARKLKLCMGALKNAGERLGRYALAKRQAVQLEDFTTAKLRKEQIELYRKSVFLQLQVEKLLERAGSQTENDAVSEVYAQKPTLPSPPSLQDVASFLAESSLSATLSPKDTSSTDSHSHGHSDSHSRSHYNEVPSSPQLNAIGRSPNRGSPTTSTGSLRRRNKSAPRNSYEDYEERAVPALRHSHTNEFLRECQGNAILDNDPCRGRSRLNDRERRQAALPILVFGNEMVELFYSHQFQDREEGLIRLRNFLKGHETPDIQSGSNKVARSAALLLHRAVRDAVFSVFSQATETVRALFVEFVPERVSPSEVARCVDRLLPELLAKSGDPSARIHTLAQHTILSIAMCPEVREQHLVAPAMSRSVGSGTHPRLALSRMQMLEQLVLSQGISTDKQSGLTCRALSECGCSGIHHPAEPVRKVAERVLLLVYKVNARLVRKQLPPDDDITRRNLLYRQLFTEFDKIDAQRRKEMLEANKNAGPLCDTMSPPLAAGKTFSPTEMRTKCRVNGSRDVTSSPIRRSETRILKSKSGHALAEKGAADANGFNGQEKVKQGITFESSRKSSNSDSLEDSDEILRCPFCDWQCRGDSSQLDKHYWKACPVLTKCPQCSIVLEVANLNYHLISECEAKFSYMACDRCTESVHRELYELHLMEDYCRELTTGAARCPLCHDNVNLPLDGGWKLHLVSSSGCPGTARRRAKV